LSAQLAADCRAPHLRLWPQVASGRGSGWSAGGKAKATFIMELERIMWDIDEYVRCPSTSAYNRPSGGVVKREELKSAVKVVYETVMNKLGRQGVDRLFSAFERLARLRVYALHQFERVAVSYGGDVDVQLVHRQQNLKLYVCHRGLCRELVREHRRVQQFPYPVLAIVRQGNGLTFEELKKREEGDTGQYVWALKPYDMRAYVGEMVARWLFPDEAVRSAALTVARFYNCIPYHPAFELVYKLYDLGALK